ncbi:PAS domain S-box protein [Larkinella insperata]|uniref:histidine kinase n=1 Tax=Larkinella insperata TaxID=332158 RepID=A0ABW3QH40_9BACT|nr:PAS domain S-box protein [Larkinella insperata]
MNSTQSHPSAPAADDFKTLVESFARATWETDAAGNFSTDSPGWRAYTGQSRESWRDAGWVEAVHPNQRQLIREHWQQALAQRTPLNVEARVSRPDGNWQWTNVRAAPVISVDGSASKWVGMGIDISAQKQSELELRESEATYRTLFETMDQGFCIIEVLFDSTGKPYDYRFLELNAAFEQQTGLKNAVGKTIRQFAPNHEEHWFEMYGRIALTGEPARFKDSAVALGRFYEVYAFRVGEPEKRRVAVLFNDILDRIIARQKQEEIQRQVLTFFEQSPVGIAIISGPALIYTMVNPFYLELVGRTYDQMIGESLLDVLPELRDQGFDQIILDVMNTGQPYNAREVAVELIRNQQRETIYVDLAFQPQYDVDRSILGVMVIATDVTQQVKTRQSVEASEARLRSIVATAPAAMGLFVGRDLVVELPNQAFIDIVGKGPDIVGKPLREVMPELENQAFLQILDDVYTSGKMYQSFGTQVNIVQEGVMTHNYYNITYTPLLDDQGQTYAILDIAIDVTEAIKSRQKIEEAESALRGAVELAELGTWELNVTTGRITYSDRIKSWFGFTKDEVEHSQVYNPIHEEDRQRVATAIQAALAPGSPGSYDEEYRLIDYRTGHVRIIHAQGRVYLDDQGRPLKVMGTAQDVTQQRQLQLALEQQVQQRTEELAAANEELAAANEELQTTNEDIASINEQLHALVHDLKRSNDNLQQFAYIASHDLQEPLRKIQAFSSLLQHQYGERLGPDGLDYLERMQTAGERMSAFIRDLLAYSRISTRQQKHNVVALNDIMEKVLQTLEFQIQQTQAQLDIDPLPMLNGDASQLSQLFQNLLSNALKFTRKDASGVSVPPRIQIRVSQVAAGAIPVWAKPISTAENFHQICVTDHGIGFDNKYQERIFQLFQRLHGKSDYAGTGIGLAICQRVVENHGGTITADSQPGQGATFCIYLPT